MSNFDPCALSSGKEPLLQVNYSPLGKTPPCRPAAYIWNQDVLVFGVKMTAVCLWSA